MTPFVGETRGVVASAEKLGEDCSGGGQSEASLEKWGDRVKTGQL